MSVHYQSKANPLNQANAQRITIDGFDVLIAFHVGGVYKATFMNGLNYTEWYNEEHLHDATFTSFEAAKEQCKKYVNAILESAYESAYDL